MFVYLSTGKSTDPFGAFYGSAFWASRRGKAFKVAIVRPRSPPLDMGNFYGNTIWITFSFPVTRYFFVGNPGFSNTNTLPIGTRMALKGVWPRLFLSTPSRKTSAQGLALIRRSTSKVISARVVSLLLMTCVTCLRKFP